MLPTQTSQPSTLGREHIPQPQRTLEEIVVATLSALAHGMEILIDEQERIGSVAASSERTSSETMRIVQKDQVERKLENGSLRQK